MHTIVFLSCSEEITVFCRFLEAIDFAFVRTSYQLLKITFQKKTEDGSAKRYLLASLARWVYFIFLFLQDKTSTFSTFWADKFSLAKYNLFSVLISWSTKSIGSLSWVFALVSGLNDETSNKKIVGTLSLGSYALGFLGGTSKVATRFFNFFQIFQISSRFIFF